MGVSLGGGKKKRGEATPDINITPLVDVVLVLLIIFMVVMPLMNHKFWLQVPKEPDNTEAPPPPPPDAKPPPVLYVDPSGAVMLNSEIIPPEQFIVRIERAAAATPDGVVFFDAADTADYAKAVEVMDRAKKAGANVAVLPEGLKMQTAEPVPEAP